MLEIYQKTISEPISFRGVGLHTGLKSSITIFPGRENQGIVFKRSDLKKNNLIFANFQNVSSAKLCTTLENEMGVKVSTVEHLLAAFYISGIDNATVEVDNQEIPIMDGSAREFLEILGKIGTVKLNSKRKYLKVLEKVELVDKSKILSIEPSEHFIVDFKLNYKNPIIGKQKNLINFNKDDIKEVSSSRTFCLFEDIEKIKKQGLAKGGSLDNAIVIDGDKILNKDGLRNKKEFVNHKILDLAGDFLLSGYRVIGKVFCNQGGHELTNNFLKRLFNTKTSFTILENKNLINSKKIQRNQTEKLAVNA